MNINPIDVFYTDGNASITNIIPFLKMESVKKIIRMIDVLCEYDENFSNDVKNVYTDFCLLLQKTESDMLKKQYERIFDHAVYKHEDFNADFCLDVA